MLKIHLVGLKHAIEPRQKLLGAVIGVDYHRDAIELGHLANVQGHRDGTSDRCLFLGLLVVDALAGNKSSSTVRHL